MLEKLKAEPALVTGIVLAVVGVLAAFGLGITSGQSDAVVSLIGSLLALVGAGVTRSKVVPMSKMTGASRTESAAGRMKRLGAPRG